MSSVKLFLSLYQMTLKTFMMLASNYEMSILEDNGCLKLYNETNGVSLCVIEPFEQKYFDIIQSLNDAEFTYQHEKLYVSGAIIQIRTSTHWGIRVTKITDYLLFDNEIFESDVYDFSVERNYNLVKCDLNGFYEDLMSKVEQSFHLNSS